jgi:hypothetical protein
MGLRGARRVFTALVIFGIALLAMFVLIVLSTNPA